MRITRGNLRTIIREMIEDTYQSHTDDPAEGDMVININPKCKHRNSKGVVLRVNDLPEESGKTAEYMCFNDGPTWEPGDVLEKTLDQLAPLEVLCGKDPGEGKMARGQLARSAEVAEMLLDLIQDDSDLDEWVESKITKSHDYLTTVFDYMRGKQGS